MNIDEDMAGYLIIETTVDYQTSLPYISISTCSPSSRVMFRLSRILQEPKTVGLIDLVLAVLCLLGFLQLQEKPWIEAQVSGVDQTLKVIQVHEGQSPFRNGDVIAEVDGLHITNPEELELILDGHVAGEKLTFGLIRHGESIRETVLLVPYYSVMYQVLVLLSGIVFFGVGVYVFRKRPEDRGARLFHWASVFASGMIMATWGSYVSLPEVFSYPGRFLHFVSYAFLPTVFAHFTFFFPRKKGTGLLRWIAIPYALSVILTVLQIWTMVAFLLNPSSAALHAFSFSFELCVQFFLIGMLFAVGNFIHSAWTTRDEGERRKLRLVLAGLMGPISFILLYRIPKLFGAPPIVEEEWIVAAATLAPISFAVSFVTYNLMNVDLFLRRSTTYLMALGLLVVLFGAMDYIIHAWMSATVGFGGLVVVSVVSVLVYILFLEPRRGIFLNYVERRLFNIRYDFREAQGHFSELIKHSVDIESLSASLVKSIQEVIPVKRIGLFLVRPDGQRLTLVAGDGFTLLDHVGVEFQVEALNTSLQIPVALSECVEPGARFEEADREVFIRWKIALAIAMLTEKGEITGFLVVGPKKSGERFSLEDVDLLNRIALEAGLAIERIQLLERLIITRTESQRLKELSELKSYFVSSVSHELKTPLTSIRMFAEMLESRVPDGDDKSRKYLRIIEGEADRLSRLISDVLDYARIERGEKSYRIAPQPLQPVIDHVLAVLEYQLSMKQFEVRLDLCANDVVIPIDGDSVEQALMNLLSNAMKYSGNEKRIELSTKTLDNEVVIEVRDHGVGIHENDIAKLGTPFFRTGDQQSTAGAGLGLNIVRHIMKAHKGAIRIQSSPGRGSTFSLHFPIQEITERE